MDPQMDLSFQADVHMVKAHTDGCPGGKQRVALNSADPVYAELRDLSFAAVGPVLGERAKAIQADYHGSKVCATTIPMWRTMAGSWPTHWVNLLCCSAMTKKEDALVSGRVANFGSCMTYHAC